MKKLALMCLVASMAFGLQLETASAGTPGDSEIDQYTESLPNGDGNKPTNSPGDTDANSGPGTSSGPSGTTGTGSTVTGGSGSGSGDSGGNPGSGGSDAKKLGSFIQSSSPASNDSSGTPLINASGAGDDSNSFLDTLTGSGSAGPILPIVLIVAILGGSAYFIRMRRDA